MSGTTNGNIVEQMTAMEKRINERLDAIEAEIRPVSQAYQAATIGARLLKWTVGVLASIAAIWAFWSGGKVI